MNKLKVGILSSVVLWFGAAAQVQGEEAREYPTRGEMFEVMERSDDLVVQTSRLYRSARNSHAPDVHFRRALRDLQTFRRAVGTFNRDVERHFERPIMTRGSHRALLRTYQRMRRSFGGFRPRPHLTQLERRVRRTLQEISRYY